MSLSPTFPLRSAFLALPLEGTAKRQFQALQEALVPYADILHFQKPDSPHLTLQFWPSLMEIEYGPIVEQCQKIAAKCRPFMLEIQGADVFRKRGEDRVLFLNVAFSPELATVKKLCPWPSGQPFSPHITLARIRHPNKFRVQKKRILKEVEDAAFPWLVDRLRLYANIEGRNQTQIEEFLFAP